MEFEVQLIKVPPLDEMGEGEVFDLNESARNIFGRYWMFEGCVWALVVGPRVEVLAKGYTKSHAEILDDEFHEHCLGVFGDALPEPEFGKAS